MYDLVHDQMESVNNAILSVPLMPRESYQLRLFLAACKASGHHVSQADGWQAAQGDMELKHRSSMIHRYLISLPMGEFTEVAERLLKAQEKGQR